MDKQLSAKYYGRPDIQKALLSFAQNREIAVRFDTFYGKRPDIMENLFDVRAFVKKWASSFHMSEERWLNPLLLGQNQSQEEVTKNRVGWDLILDLDGVDFEYAKIAGKIILDFLEELGVKNVSTKFSGNKGFHIGVPFEAFSSEIIGIGKLSKIFPEAPRKIAMYMMYELRGKISKTILEHSGSIEQIAKKYNLDVSDLIIDDEISHNLDYLKLIEIDTILIATRHLFRMPYSFNEKSSLISIPIRNDSIMDFERFLAKPEKVNPEHYKDFEFLKYNPDYGKDADILLLKAYEDDYEDKISESIFQDLKQKKAENTVLEITEEVELKDFPKTISYVLNNNFDDGRKRAIFLLLTFLYSVNWNDENIERTILEWNEKQESGLKENYIHAQINWFKSQDKKISPPNFDNDNYYKAIGIPKSVIEEDVNRFKNQKSKNPFHYVYILLKKTNNKGTPKKGTPKKQENKK